MTAVRPERHRDANPGAPAPVREQAGAPGVVAALAAVA